MDGRDGLQGRDGIAGPQGPQGPKGDTGATGATGAQGASGTGVVSGDMSALGSRISLPYTPFGESPYVPVMAASSSNGTSFVTVTLTVETVNGQGQNWNGYAQCDWQSGVTTGSAGRVPIQYNGNGALKPGATIVAMAQISESNTGVLACKVVTTSTGGITPEATIVVGGAMAITVNQPNSGNTQFSGLG
jgi:hypothetical protein